MNTQFFTWDNEVLSYSEAFHQFDPDYALQTTIEEQVAARLYDDYHNEDMHEHAAILINMIIAVCDLTAPEYVHMANDVTTRYLLKWQCVLGNAHTGQLRKRHTWQADYSHSSRSTILHHILLQRRTYERRHTP